MNKVRIRNGSDDVSDIGGHAGLYGSRVIVCSSVLLFRILVVIMMLRIRLECEYLLLCSLQTYRVSHDHLALETPKQSLFY